MIRPCKRCKKEFEPYKSSTKLCDLCWEKARRPDSHNRKKSNYHINPSYKPRFGSSVYLSFTSLARTMLKKRDKRIEDLEIMLHKISARNFKLREQLKIIKSKKKKLKLLQNNTKHLNTLVSSNKT